MKSLEEIMPSEKQKIYESKFAALEKKQGERIEASGMNSSL